MVLRHGRFGTNALGRCQLSGETDTPGGRFPGGRSSGFFSHVPSPIAQKLTEDIGQQVVVDNRVGVSGMIAAEHITRCAPADGYTVYFAGTGVLAFAANLFAKLPIDVNKEMMPLTLGVTVPEMLVVHPSLPVKTTKALAGLAKAKPGQVSCGSTGNGGMPHLAVESLRVAAGIELTHVPYKGAAPAVILERVCATDGCACAQTMFWTRNQKLKPRL